jgi:hypothetical protein
VLDDTVAAGDQQIPGRHRDGAGAAGCGPDRGIYGRGLARDAVRRAADQQAAGTGIAHRQQALGRPVATIDHRHAGSTRALSDSGCPVAHRGRRPKQAQHAGAGPAHNHCAGCLDLLKIKDGAGAASLLAQDEVIPGGTGERQRATGDRQQAVIAEADDGGAAIGQAGAAGQCQGAPPT